MRPSQGPSGERKLLLTVKEVKSAVVPFNIERVVYHYFKRTDPAFVSGMHRPEKRIELYSVLKHKHSASQISQETNIFESEEALANHIRLTGVISPDDVIEDNTMHYPYFAHLQFFNNVVPRPAWLDEKVRETL